MATPLVAAGSAPGVGGAGAGGSNGTTSPSSLINADERAHLCSLLETQQYGPAVKAVFDRQLTAKGEYQQILQEAITNKQTQIKQICEEHYGEFLSGIEHLLSVKLEVADLRSRTASLNQSVQQSGRALLASARMLNEQRRVRYQINCAKQIVSSCAALIALARKAKQQIQHAKFFSALKTLNQLQRILHVAASSFQSAAASGKSASSRGNSPPPPTTRQPAGSLSLMHAGGGAGAGAAGAGTANGAESDVRFEFIRQLERQIPLLTAQIKESVKGEFQSWLQSVSRKAHSIGELALSQLDDALSAAEKRAQASVKSRRRRKHRRARHSDEDEDDDGGFDEEFETDEEVSIGVDAPSTSLAAASLFDALPVNFTPIYQCLHIYEHLGLAEQFQTLYKERRTAQLSEILAPLAAPITLRSPPSSPSTAAGGGSGSSTAGGTPPERDLLELYPSVFAGVAGFFLIEDAILKSGNELLSRAEVEQLYEKLQSELIGHIGVHMRSSTRFQTPSFFLQAKYAVLLLAKLMDESCLGLSSHLLRSFLEESRARFEGVLTTRFQGELRLILSKERWEPLGINDAREYDLFVRAFGLQDDSVHVGFPCTMPFSISVPLLSRVLANFVEDLLAYGRGLPLAHEVGSWRASVAAALDRLLAREVNGCMLDLLSQSPSSLPISQAVQFSINAQVLSELTCASLERLISGGAAAGSEESHSSHTASSSVVRLSARDALLSTKLRAEDTIFELISHKIDAFVDLGIDCNWTPDSVSPHPSDYLLDLLAYLETTFAQMSFMPDAVREAVHFTSCKRIGGALTDALSDPSHPHCRKFNILAIANLNQDLQLLETFAARCPIPNLVETFAELRQVIDLLLSGEVEVLLDPAARAARYPLLSNARVIRILDKYKEVSMFSLSTPAQFKKLKRKNIDAVIKQLQRQ